MIYPPQNVNIKSENVILLALALISIKSDDNLDKRPFQVQATFSVELSKTVYLFLAIYGRTAVHRYDTARHEICIDVSCSTSVNYIGITGIADGHFIDPFKALSFPLKTYLITQREGHFARVQSENSKNYYTKSGSVITIKTIFFGVAKPSIHLLSRTEFEWSGYHPFYLGYAIYNNRAQKESHTALMSSILPDLAIIFFLYCLPYPRAIKILSISNQKSRTMTLSRNLVSPLSTLISATFHSLILGGVGSPA